MKYLLLLFLFLVGCAYSSTECVQTAMIGHSDHPETKLTYEQAMKVCGIK